MAGNLTKATLSILGGVCYGRARANLEAETEQERMSLMNKEGFGGWWGVGLMKIKSRPHLTFGEGPPNSASCFGRVLFYPRLFQGGVEVDGEPGV